MTTRTTVGEIQLELGSVGHPGHNRIDENQSEDGEAKEMIIGVGNCNLYLGVWEIGVPRALGGIHLRRPAFSVGSTTSTVIQFYYTPCHVLTQNATTRACRPSHRRVRRRLSGPWLQQVLRPSPQRAVLFTHAPWSPRAGPVARGSTCFRRSRSEETKEVYSFCYHRPSCNTSRS